MDKKIIKKASTLIVMKCENGFIVGDRQPYSGERGNEYVASDYPSLNNLIFDLMEGNEIE